MHKGEDTDFYLNKGFNVVGFEADPELIVFCKNRFKNEIAKKKLIIIEGAIVDRISNNRIKFYKNNVNSVWGTIVPDWSERNGMDKATSEVIYVNEVNFNECGKRISKQSWNLFPKIKEAQEFLDNKSINKLRVFEVHPELSFMAMNDMILVQASKKTDIGREIRIKLIQKFFPKFSFESVRNEYKKNQALDDDIVDSVSVLWSTQRIVDNIANFVPKDPKRIDMRIYF